MPWAIIGAMNFARQLWLRIETINAVTYFGEETDAAGRAAGVTGLWFGFLCHRAAPRGRALLFFKNTPNVGGSLAPPPPPPPP